METKRAELRINIRSADNAVQLIDKHDVYYEHSFPDCNWADLINYIIGGVIEILTDLEGKEHYTATEAKNGQNNSLPSLSGKKRNANTKQG